MYGFITCLHFILWSATFCPIYALVQQSVILFGLLFIKCTDDKSEGVGSSEDDQDNSGGETELPEIDPRAEDRELKNHLLRKYSGYLGSLKQELSKKKKKGKLPKEARQKLLSWWELHYKWPYPSVSGYFSNLNSLEQSIEGSTLTSRLVPC